MGRLTVPDTFAEEDLMPTVYEHIPDTDLPLYPDQRSDSRDVSQVQEQIPYPDQRSPLEASYGSTARIAPDQAAQIIDYSRRTGLTREQVEKHLQEVKLSADTPDSNAFAEFEKTHPGASRWLYSPDNMAIARDDLGNVRQHEDVVKIATTASSWVDAIEAGYQGSVPGMQFRGKMPDLRPQEYDSYFSEDFLKNKLSQVVGLAADTPTMIVGGMAAMGTIAPISAALGVTGVGLLPAAVLTAVEGMAGGFALPALLKSAMASKYQEHEIKGFEDALNRTSRVLIETGKGYVTGAAAGAAGLGAVKLGGGNIAKLSSEIVAMETVGKGLEGEAPTAHGMIDSLLLLGGIHFASGIAGKLADYHIEAKKTELAENFFTAIGDTSEASKARERLPEAHSELVGELTKDGPVQDIYVTTEKFEEFFQSKKQDPEAEAGKLGVADEYAKSKVTGEDMKVPLATWIKEFVGTDVYKALHQDIRLPNQKFTPRELKTVEEQFDQELGRYKAEADKQVADDKIRATSASVGKEIGDQLRGIGMPEDQIPANAMAWEVVFRTLAKKTGKDPLELFKKYNVRIVRGEELPMSPEARAQQDIEGPPRGIIQVGSNNSINIGIFKDADASSFIHETGHFLLNVMRDFANDPEAPPEMKGDFEKILKFIGAESGDKITKIHHEKWASAIETYFREGKAPSKELIGTFERFKEWLFKIYSGFKINGVELSPEITDVMDRMFASKEEVEAARQEIGYKDEVSKLDPKNAPTLQEMRLRAKASAEAELLKMQLPETKKAHKDFLAKELARITKESEAKVADMPLFRASDAILATRASTTPIDELANRFIDGKLSHNDQVVFNEVAFREGFKDGDNLARQIIIAHTENLRENAVNELVKQGMVGYQDVMSKGVLKASAMEVIHTEQTQELLHLEAQFLNNLMIKDPTRREWENRRAVVIARQEAAQARVFAAEALGSVPFKDSMRVRQLITAERKAAERVSAALARGDIETAVKYKKQQAINHAMVAEAMRNAKEAPKALKYLVGIGKHGPDLLNVPYSFMRIVDGMLEGHELKPPTKEDSETWLKIAQDKEAKDHAPDEIASKTGWFRDETGQWKQEAFPDLVARVNSHYGMFIPSFGLKGEPKSYKELTMDELRGFHDTVRELMKFGRDYDTFVKNEKKVSVSEASAEAAESVRKNVGEKYGDSFKLGRTQKNRAAKIASDVLSFSLFDQSIPWLVHLEALVNVMDNEDVNGPMHNHLYRVLAEGRRTKILREEKEAKAYNEVLAKYMSPEEYAKEMKKSIYVKELDGFVDKETGKKIDGYLDKEEILAIAMNWGNETNRNRIRIGYKLTDEQVQGIIDLLDKRDMDHVQRVLDYTNTYWADVVALETKLRGVVPQKVEATPILTKHGIYDGGYYPIGYDYEKSIEAKQTMLDENALYKQGGYATAMTNTGHTKSRAAYVNRPIRLRNDVLSNHLANVIHDLSYRESIIDANKFMRQQDVRKAISDAFGLPALEMIDNVIKATAGNQQRYTTAGDKIFNWIKGNVGFTTLAFKVKNLPMDLTGNTALAMREIGSNNMMVAAKEYYADKQGHDAFIYANSPFMKKRSSLKEASLRNEAKSWSEEEGALKQYGFRMYMIADENVSKPLWVSVFKQNLAKHGKEVAIDAADEAVVRTFGSGDVIDQVGAQRAQGGAQLLAMYMTWSSMMFNRYWKSTNIAGMEYNAGNRQKAMLIQADAVANVVLVPALIQFMYKELFRNSQQPSSKDDRLKRLTREVVQQGLGYVWGLRDLSSAFLDLSEGRINANYHLSPVEQALFNVMKPPAKALQLMMGKGKPWSVKNTEETARAVSTLTGFPQQFNDIAFNFYDWAQGKGSLTYRDLVMRRTKK